MLMKLASAAMLIVLTPSLSASCDRPWPVMIPDQVPAEEELVQLQRAVRSYLEKANAYLECNDAEQASIPFDPDDPASVQAADEAVEILVRRYNNTVDEMHVVGENFNQLVRAYKAAQEDEDD